MLAVKALMKRLRELVTDADPEELYNEMRIVGEGASGKVYAAKEKVLIFSYFQFFYHVIDFILIPKNIFFNC